jgi:adenylate cyclase
VIGDAVNLAARLEGLCSVYGVNVIASDATRAQAPGVVWQALGRARVKGKATSVSVCTPLADQAGAQSAAQTEELRLWDMVLHAWREQNWPLCEGYLAHLQRVNDKKVLYRLFSERVATRKALPFDPGWEGSTTFDTQ